MFHVKVISSTKSYLVKDCDYIIEFNTNEYQLPHELLLIPMDKSSGIVEWFKAELSKINGLTFELVNTTFYIKYCPHSNSTFIDLLHNFNVFVKDCRNILIKTAVSYIPIDKYRRFKPQIDIETYNGMVNILNVTDDKVIKVYYNYNSYTLISFKQFLDICDSKIKVCYHEDSNSSLESVLVESMKEFELLMRLDTTETDLNQINITKSELNKFNIQERGLADVGTTVIKFFQNLHQLIMNNKDEIKLIITSLKQLYSSLCLIVEKFKQQNIDTSDLIDIVDGLAKLIN